VSRKLRSIVVLVASSAVTLCISISGELTAAADSVDAGNAYVVENTIVVKTAVPPDEVEPTEDVVAAERLATAKVEYCLSSTVDQCVFGGPGPSPVTINDRYYNCADSPSGANCNYHDPVNANCSSHASTVGDDDYQDSNGDHYLELRWSQGCQSNWGRFSTSYNANVVTDLGYNGGPSCGGGNNVCYDVNTQQKYYGQMVWSLMLYGGRGTNCTGSEGEDQAYGWTQETPCV
jgi:hypothetical protein